MCNSSSACLLLYDRFNSAHAEFPAFGSPIRHGCPLSKQFPSPRLDLCSPVKHVLNNYAKRNRAIDYRSGVLLSRSSSATRKEKMAEMQSEIAAQYNIL